MTVWQRLARAPRQPVLWLIRLYQRTISPDHGWFKHLYEPYGFCRFTPTCSQYGYEVIARDGLIRGLPKSIYRIIRCNPWNPGGEDKP